MAEKKRGISPDLLIHPGETISDILKERNITQKELACRAGVSEAFLSDVIHGKKDISKGLAMGLEYALGVSKSFWLNLQANYDAELLDYLEEDTVSDEEKDVLDSIHEVVEYLKEKSAISEDLTPEQSVIHLRKLFRVSSLKGLRSLAPAGIFKVSDKAAINCDLFGAWLCLCKLQQSSLPAGTGFDAMHADEPVLKIRQMVAESEGDLPKKVKNMLDQKTMG